MNDNPENYLTQSIYRSLRKLPLSALTAEKWPYVCQGKTIQKDKTLCT